MTPLTKYTMNPSCDWCGRTPAKPFTLETRGSTTGAERAKAIIVSVCSDHKRTFEAQRDVAEAAKAAKKGRK